MNLHRTATSKARTSWRCLIASIATATVLFSCKKDAEQDTPALPDPASCTSVAAAHGLIADLAAGTFVYTGAGGTRVSIEQDQIRVSYQGYVGFLVSYWGMNSAGGQGILVANHQSLNGKHIKDRNGARISLIMPDGVKITMAADGPGATGTLRWISIFDGDRAHLVNLTCKTVIFSGNSAAAASALDDRDADGETSEVRITTTGLLWNNIYQEDTPGNKFENIVPLGELDKANPTQVRDYYDDPRLGHT